MILDETPCINEVTKRMTNVTEEFKIKLLTDEH